jgi:transposase
MVRGLPRIFVEFAREDCQGCPARALCTRALCTRAQRQGRRVRLPPQAQYAAVRATRAWSGSEEGQQQYKQRAGVEGTLSQGVRGFGLRYARYRGLTWLRWRLPMVYPKTRLLSAMPLDLLHKIPGVSTRTAA